MSSRTRLQHEGEEAYDGRENGQGNIEPSAQSLSAIDFVKVEPLVQLE
jgi:hypothetical protein